MAYDIDYKIDLILQKVAPMADVNDKIYEIKEQLATMAANVEHINEKTLNAHANLNEKINKMSALLESIQHTIKGNGTEGMQTRLARIEDRVKDLREPPPQRWFWYSAIPGLAAFIKYMMENPHK